MSVDCPWKPPVGWWMRMRLFGSAARLPCAPPARISEPIDIAIPQHVFATSGLMKRMVS
jgi:hypothetical protein